MNLQHQEGFGHVVCFIMHEPIMPYSVGPAPLGSASLGTATLAGRSSPKPPIRRTSIDVNNTTTTHNKLHVSKAGVTALINKVEGSSAMGK